MRMFCIENAPVDWIFHVPRILRMNISDGQVLCLQGQETYAPGKAHSTGTIPAATLTGRQV